MHRPDRSLLLERDPEKTAAPPIRSLREVDWRHQSAALVAGYNSVTDMAVDELIVLVRDLQDRVDTLERFAPHANTFEPPPGIIEP